MKRACAVCLFLVTAHLGHSQMSGIDRQFRMWSDYADALSNSNSQEQQIFANSGRNNSDPSVDRISVSRLRHKVPRKALSAFLHGVDLAGAGNFRSAVKEFERAVMLDPECSEAHGNLGVMYLDLGTLDRAVDEFRVAVHLDPTGSFHHANLAVALILLNLPNEAEPEAQAAFDLDHSNVKARYLLGSLLARRPETRGRAAEHLMYAAQELPDAHMVLAEMYRTEGAEALAQMEQERYRKATPDTTKAPQMPWR